MKLYVSFGSDHKHTALGQTVGGLDQVAEIPCDDHTMGRQIAFALFDDKFCTTYTEDEINSLACFKDVEIVPMFKTIE